MAHRAPPKNPHAFFSGYVKPWTKDIYFPAAFFLLALASLLPLWRGRFLPLLDEPNHLSAIYIWHFLNDPASRLKEFYELRIQLVPYSAYYFLVHATAFVTGLESANKVVLSAYVLALPTAALLWTRRTQRSPWLSILAFPLSYSYSWSHGFHPFNIGIALFLFALIALDAYLERSSPWRASAVALSALACDLAHPIALLALYISIAPLLLTWRPGLKRLLASLALITPSAALFAWQVSHRQSNVITLKQDAGGLFKGQYLSPLEMLRMLPTYTLDTVSGSGDLIVFDIMLISAGLLLIGGKIWPMARPLGHQSFWHSHRGAFLALAMLMGYFLLPLHLQKPFDWWFVSGRFAPLICFFICLLPRIDLRGSRRWLMAPALCAAFYLPVHISGKYAEFNQRAAPFVSLIEATAAGKNILYLGMKPPSDPAVNIHAYNQFGAWVQILRGGYSGSGWFESRFPFEAIRRLPGPPWYEHEQFRPSLHAGAYDYVIVRNEKKAIFGPTDRAWKLSRREGEWALYERVQAETAP